ncbi:hypothetical protein POM88_046954 [Heracleum sosnowskyi]|uniref:Uncharacterized protein n=1 Tax=Heracleum sosnowskyi TaxID=360622 RepID=A0AAD8H7U1_9APIA|nr:hypothetical protein POM88_046954 [Heracleum sosnowskyi]
MTYNPSQRLGSFQLNPRVIARGQSMMMHSLRPTHYIVDPVTRIARFYNAYPQKKRPPDLQFLKFSPLDGGSNIQNLGLQNIQARIKMVMAFMLASLLPWVYSKPGFYLVLGSSYVDEGQRQQEIERKERRLYRLTLRKQATVIAPGKHTATFRLSNVSGRKADLLEIPAKNPILHVLFIPGNPATYAQFSAGCYRN